MKFLYRDCDRFFEKTLTNDFVDTLRLAKLIFPDWKHRRLADLASYYGISTVGAHRALADCKMNQKVFEMLGKELAGEGTLSAKPDIKLCPRCGQPLKKRNGRFGEFFGCTGYPDCRYTENIEKELPWN
nr:topoisomerase DNA-binding C4 zinc finger domain-containing protein [Lachnospiraceae bacterium]